MSTNDCVIGGFILFLFGMILGCLLGICLDRGKMARDAISNGVATYDNRGSFTWIPNEERRIPKKK